MGETQKAIAGDLEPQKERLIIFISPSCSAGYLLLQMQDGYVLMSEFPLSKSKHPNTPLFLSRENFQLLVLFQRMQHTVPKLNAPLSRSPSLSSALSSIHSSKLMDWDPQLHRWLPRKIVPYGQSMSRGAFPTYHSNAVFKGLPGEGSWSVHGLAIIIWAPAGAVDMHVLGIEANRFRFNHVRDIAIQHPNPFQTQGNQLEQRLHCVTPKQPQTYSNYSIWGAKDKLKQQLCEHTLSPPPPNKRIMQDLLKLSWRVNYVAHDETKLL